MCSSHHYVNLDVAVHSVSAPEEKDKQSSLWLPINSQTKSRMVRCWVFILFQRYVPYDVKSLFNDSFMKKSKAFKFATVTCGVLPEIV